MSDTQKAENTFQRKTRRCIYCEQLVEPELHYYWHAECKRRALQCELTACQEQLRAAQEQMAPMPRSVVIDKLNEQLKSANEQLAKEREARNESEGDRTELQAKCGHLEQQIKAAEAVERLVKDCQDDLAKWIVPDSGISDHDVLNTLLGRLDGPQARAALAAEGEKKCLS